MFDPRMILMLAAGTLLLLNGLMARGDQPNAEGTAEGAFTDRAGEMSQDPAPADVSRPAKGAEA